MIRSKFPVAKLISVPFPVTNHGMFMGDCSSLSPLQCNATPPITLFRWRMTMIIFICCIPFYPSSFPTNNLSSHCGEFLLNCPNIHPWLTRWRCVDKFRSDPHTFPSLRCVILLLSECVKESSDNMLNHINIILSG